ncbi:hypothetical protein R3W88_029282 [Solanum pinnatisectum]|uniref:Uncharacterized protein n=1 Tax=Solanum pinnatisectum TaxID=50273 RepID=A0AAV9K891_9SOLN|nr:hypothetical protein R3W88_029282 [Solanum pinnatisectum]
MWWQPLNGSAQFLFDNWTGMGVLYDITPEEILCDVSIPNVKDLIEASRWNVQRLNMILPQKVTNDIVNIIQPLIDSKDMDKPWWMLESNEYFFVKFVSE